jgi:hypothetical protein
VIQGKDASQPGDGLAMLVWTLPVRLLDVSRGGCLVEVSRHLEAGTNGQLQLHLNGVLHLDDVRVCRCQMREGASRVHHAGVELLRTRRLSRRSLRLAMRRIIGDHGGPVDDRSGESPRLEPNDGRELRRKRGDCRAPPALVETQS